VGGSESGEGSGSGKSVKKQMDAKNGSQGSDIPPASLQILWQNSLDLRENTRPCQNFSRAKTTRPLPTPTKFSWKSDKRDMRLDQVLYAHSNSHINHNWRSEMLVCAASHLSYSFSTHN
jgi:hypothetical protein